MKEEEGNAEHAKKNFKDKIYSVVHHFKWTISQGIIYQPRSYWQFLIDNLVMVKNDCGLGG